MSWFKTFRKKPKIKENASRTAALEYVETGDTNTYVSHSHPHQYSAQKALRGEQPIMGYEDTVRAPRKFYVDSSPMFVQNVKGKIFMTDYTQTIRIYNSNGKRLESVHAESPHSMLSGIATNRTENSLYVCDAHAKGLARVQIFNVADDITPVVYLGHGLFQAPHGITLTHDDKVLVTDVERKEVFIIQEDGFNALCFGGPGVRPGQFSFPHDVAFDTLHNRIVVSDTHLHRLQVFDQHGAFIQVVSHGRNEERLFKFPTGLTFDNAGNLIVCDNGSDSLKILDSELNLVRTTNMGSMGLWKPTSVTLLQFERLCVSSREHSSLIIF